MEAVRVVAERALAECSPFGSFVGIVAALVAEYSGPPRPDQIVSWTIDFMGFQWLVPAAVPSLVAYSLTVNTSGRLPIEFVLFRRSPSLPTGAGISCGPMPGSRRPARPPRDAEPRLMVRVDNQALGANGADASSDPHSCLWLNGGDALQIYSDSTWASGDAISFALAFLPP
jgi:hypothetical protein